MLYELKRIRKASGLSQVEAAAHFGVPLGTYRNWEQCIYMPRENKTLLKIARFFEVTVEELFGYDMVSPGAFSFIHEEEDGVVALPLFGRIAAGKPLEMDAVEDHLQISRALFRRYPEAFFLRIEGSSMNRVLPNGSFALIDPRKKEEDVVSGHIYALCVNGYDATVKVVKKLANGYTLIPDSTDLTYKPQTFDYGEPGTDEVTIIGEVVWYTVPPDFMSNYQYAVMDI